MAEFIVGGDTNPPAKDPGRFYAQADPSDETGFIDEEEEDDSQNKGKQVVVGICAMEKKSLSKPMREILTRLEEFEYITTLIFPENVILYEVVEKWPLCDCLIAFHSKGFPLVKAIRYANLRKPYIINNLEMQFDIQDRRSVYNILAKEGIEIPRHAILDRNSPDPDESSLLEFDDHVEVNGVVFNKPFVEKPISAEDHNIFMYYPTSAGGGSQRLFRKIGSRSSVYSSESGVRKDGSYIYEDFMPTDGTDVKCLFPLTLKVYTVGPDYAHAEARKSPALDGKVERDSEGKEVRYPVILSNKEKLIARKVCMAFKQMVCGFDLLRANGKSIVCDVNGFSFVKNSSKYYDDCAKILGNMILRELAPTLHIPWTMPFQLDDPPIVPTTVGKMMELRCVVGVIRHGDRTPKQKMKLEVKHPKFFEIFRKYDGFKEKHIKLKKPQQLQEILDISRELLNQIKCGSVESEMIEEKRSKLEQIKNVLEMYGHFSGINRKVQLKYQPKGRPRNTSSDDDKPREASLLLILKWGGELTPSGRFQAEELGRVFRCMYPGGQDLLIGGLPPIKEKKPRGGKKAPNADAALPAPKQPPTESGPQDSLCTSCSGQDCSAPTKNDSNTHNNGEYAGTQGLGLLRLHSTYRHDLKIYASDEGRVQMTAAAFAKGLLALEGELTPILVQMVKSANTNGLLDNDSDCSSKYQNMKNPVPREELHICHFKNKRRKSGLLSNAEEQLPDLPNYFNSNDENNRLQTAKESVKSKLHEMMQQTRDFSQEDSEQLNPCHQISITNALKFIRNPVECCKQILNLIQELNKTIESKRLEFEDSILYHGETWELMARRWSKLEKDFQNKSGLFDISKIPDIYDCIKYDLQHNRTVLQSDQAEKLYNYAQNMADVVIPQEYGMTRTEKLTIAQGICAPLLRKIRADLQRNIEEESEEDEVPVNRLNPRYSSGVSSPGRHVRTRLYFTSESHIHSLLTILAEGGLVDSKDEQWQRAMEYVSLVSELNYMTQVVIMLYEDPTKDPTSDERFHVELHFSPGVNCCVQKELPPGPGFRPHSRNQESQQNQALLEESESPRQERGDETLTGQEQKSEEPADLVAGLKSNTNSSPCLTASLKCSSADLEKVFDCIEEHTSVGPTIDENEIDISIQSSSPETQIANDLKPSEPIPIVKRVFVEDPHKDGGDGDDEAGDDDDDEEEDSDEEDYNDSRATRVGSYPETRPLDYERTQSLHEKRSKSLEKRGSRPKSLDSDSNQDGAGSKMKDVSDDSCHPSKSQSMDEVTDEDGYKRSRRRSIPSRRMSNYLKFLHELAAKGPTGARVFSTAVISGSSSAPNLKEMPAPNDNAVCSPGIRPLETLHNALSLRQLDLFLGYVTSANFKTPSPSPSRSVSSSSNYTRPPALGLFSRDSSFTMWSGPPSFVSSCESSPGLNDLFHRMRMIQLDQDDRINNAKSPSHPTH
ncbi:inositol hexakisphosphate and diphosphoinositol-pentakisphosphate kinase-like isoform X3 [Tigriopus californicus]|uniref:inositol hexakisphosphate and diphosphoinositol-pentakisphosphate kinase-like isoform X3 n=1 Tax=Tigriopus californicus TaxID=6832 RepID=UPI0027DA311D|nr:inositol hexakisphosphate and diphosphoinositol-pentakisphosphate kinase-like isoform X3 [Tigriopus californicus]